MWGQRSNTLYVKVRGQALSMRSEVKHTVCKSRRSNTLCEVRGQHTVCKDQRSNTHCQLMCCCCWCVCVCLFGVWCQCSVRFSCLSSLCCCLFSFSLCFVRLLTVKLSPAAVEDESKLSVSIVRVCVCVCVSVCLLVFVLCCVVKHDVYLMRPCDPQ